VAAASLDKLFQAAIDGRRAARALSIHLQCYGLGEPDLQVLWTLHDEFSIGIDQTTLASRLAYSAGQVSATVEKLRKRGLISQHEVPGDRRRRLWQLSADGQSLVGELIELVGESAREKPGTASGEPDLPREAAA